MLALSQHEDNNAKDEQEYSLQSRIELGHEKDELKRQVSRLERKIQDLQFSAKQSNARSKQLETVHTGERLPPTCASLGTIPNLEEWF